MTVHDIWGDFLELIFATRTNLINLKTTKKQINKSRKNRTQRDRFSLLDLGYFVVNFFQIFFCFAFACVISNKKTPQNSSLGTLATHCTVYLIEFFP